MASVLISDLYGKHLSQHDIAKGIVSPVVLVEGKFLFNFILIECGIYLVTNLFAGFQQLLDDLDDLCLDTPEAPKVIKIVG